MNNESQLKMAEVIGGIGEKKSNGGTQYYQQDRIYQGDIALAHPANLPGGSYKYAFEEPFIVASRGRNPENPSDRTVGAPTEQRLEPNSQGICNTLTTVLKDNYVAEPQWISEKGVNYICSPKRGMCTDINADVCQPLTAKGQANWTGSFISPDIEKLEKSTTIGSKEPTKILLKNGEQMTSNDNLSKLRIRKLTPKECYRLMGFDDEVFLKAEATCSNTQLYKQAGNSIVVDVLEHLFVNLKPYLYS